jgi:hypothetical protein
MTGQVRGEVFLERTLAGDRVRCELEVRGLAAPPGQDSTFTYEGVCNGRGPAKWLRRRGRQL